VTPRPSPTSRVVSLPLIGGLQHRMSGAKLLRGFAASRQSGLVHRRYSVFLSVQMYIAGTAHSVCGLAVDVHVHDV
jgi:hypothetical protein